MIAGILLDLRARGHSYQWAGRLIGGYQGGADRLIDDAGGAAVLKRADARRVAPIVETLRRAGYPTPRLLHLGLAPDGSHYVVEELASGQHITELTEDLVDQLLALVALQAGRPVCPDHNWSGYAWRVVFEGESGWEQALRGCSPQSLELLGALQAAARPHKMVAMPAGDIVHGDLCFDNILAQNGVISGIIDIEAAGNGTRVIDLANLLHCIGTDFADPGGRMQAKVRQRLLEIAEPGVNVICQIYRMMAMTAWAIAHYPPPDIQRSLDRAWEQLAAL